MKVYRDYDQAALDRQYNVRASIPDHLEIFARWKHDSEQFRASVARRAMLNLPYGSDPAQTIDLFRATQTGAPIVVFIHGGYWQSLDKSDFSYIGAHYLEDGINFGAVNYRLAPRVSMDEIVADNRAALLSLQANAATYGCDPEAIYVTGSSAGGHLTAVMVLTAWEACGGRQDLVKGGCALSGLYDLEPIRLCYLNNTVGLDATAALRHSPLRHVPERAPPLILAVGGDESEEFHRQQREFQAAWTAKGLACQVVEQADGHHFDMCDRLGRRGEPVYEAVVAMVRDALSDQAMKP
jgi:arylformamidase